MGCRVWALKAHNVGDMNAAGLLAVGVRRHWRKLAKSIGQLKLQRAERIFCCSRKFLSFLSLIVSIR